jgi:hypothetical protein
MKRGKHAAILERWSESAAALPGDGPRLQVLDCKWLKLAPGATLAAQPAYKGDIAFLRSLVDNDQLDADTKEKALSPPAPCPRGPASSPAPPLGRAGCTVRAAEGGSGEVRR